MSDGDIIFMVPGLRHAVWTVKDSICLVGDLYLPGMMMSRELASAVAAEILW